MGIGEAMVTMLNEKGIPTPLVHTMLCPPNSRMDVLSDAEVDGMVAKSKLAAKYNQVIDEQSAYEILTAKLEEAAQKTQANTTTSGKPEPSMIEKVMDNSIVKSMVRTGGNMIVRSLLGL